MGMFTEEQRQRVYEIPLVDIPEDGKTFSNRFGIPGREQVLIETVSFFVILPLIFCQWHLELTASSGKDQTQNLYLLYFPSPGHNVSITVDLLKKLERESKADDRCSSLGTAEVSGFFPADSDGFGEEVGAFVASFGFIHDITFFLRNWQVSSLIGGVKIGGKIFICNHIHVKVTLTVKMQSSNFASSNVTSTQTTTGLTGVNRKYTATLCLMNWLCHKFPSTHLSGPSSFCWYYEDDKEPAFLPCTPATVALLEQNFAKKGSLEISEHTFEIPIPIESLKHQHWIFEATSLFPTWLPPFWFLA